jgi:hypothetical protein
MGKMHKGGLAGKSEGRRTTGRTGRGRVCNIQIGFKEVGWDCVDLIWHRKGESGRLL